MGTLQMMQAFIDDQAVKSYFSFFIFLCDNIIAIRFIYQGDMTNLS